MTAPSPSIASTGAAAYADPPRYAPSQTVPADRALTVRLGFWSALVAATAAVAFLAGAVVAALLFPSNPTWSGIGAYAANYQPWAMALAVVPSLLIAPAFLALVVSLDAVAPSSRRPLARLAVAFAAVYVATVGANYFLQLTTVRHNLVAGTTEGFGLLAMDNLRGVFWALELLGYFWQGVAFLLAALALSGGWIARGIRWAAAAAFLGGALSIGVGLVGVDSFTSPLFIVSAVPWSIGFPAAAVLCAVFFRRLGGAAAPALPVELADGTGARFVPARKEKK
jgi:hypothetical protein